MTLGDVVVLLVSGLLVGALARLVVPGRQPIGCLATIAVGVVGGLLGGMLIEVMPNLRPTTLTRAVFAVVGAALLLLVIDGVLWRRR